MYVGASYCINLGRDSNNRKKYIYIIQPGLIWLLIDYFKHNNQPKTGGAVKESRERRQDYLGARGGCKSIFLATIECSSAQDCTKKSSCGKAKETPS